MKQKEDKRKKRRKKKEDKRKRKKQEFVYVNKKKKIILILNKGVHNIKIMICEIIKRDNNATYSIPVIKVDNFVKEKSSTSCSCETGTDQLSSVC